MSAGPAMREGGTHICPSKKETVEAQEERIRGIGWARFCVSAKANVGLSLSRRGEGKEEEKKNNSCRHPRTIRRR